MYNRVFDVKKLKGKMYNIAEFLISQELISFLLISDFNQVPIKNKVAMAGTAFSLLNINLLK